MSFQVSWFQISIWNNVPSPVLMCRGHHSCCMQSYASPPCFIFVLVSIKQTNWMSVFLRALLKGIPPKVLWFRENDSSIIRCFISSPISRSKNGGSRELSEAKVFFFFSDYLTMYPWQNGSPFWVSEEGEVPYYVIDKYPLALQLDSLIPSLPDYQGTGRGLAFQRRGI